MRIPTAILAAGVAALALLPTRLSQAQAQYVMNFGTMAPAGTPWSDQLSDIKTRIESESSGAIKVKLFLGGALGAEIEMLQDVARGERLQGGGFSTGAVGEALDLPVLLMPELPYMFRNNNEADVVLDEVLTEPVDAALQKKGIKFYTWTENGWRNVGTKGGPAANLADLQKYKVRSQEAAVHLDMWKALGVQSVAKPTTEVLPALKTGIVDGFDNSPLFTLAAGWAESITHYTMTRHIYQPAAVVYSKSFYEGLPADLQQVLMKDRLGEAKRGRAGVRALESELLTTMKEMGVNIVEPAPEQLKVYRTTTRPVHKQFLAAHPEVVELYGKVKEKLKTMR